MTIVIGKRIIEQSGGGIEDAPVDGQTYGRKDAAWAIVPDAADALLWGGEWSAADLPYAENTLVKDGDFTAVSIAETSDRLAPQPEGDATYNLPDDGTGFVSQADLSVVYSGHLYEFSTGGWLKKIRVWVPQLISTTTYRIIVIDETDAVNPKVTLITNPVLAENDWAVVAVDNIIVKAGTKLRILLDSLNSGSNTIVSGGWNYTGTDQSVGPISQGWNRDNQHTLVRINKTDLDSVDRSTELNGITIDSTIQFVQTSDTTKYYTYTVIGTPIDQGTYVSYPVVITDSGNGGIDVAAASTTTITIPVAQSTQYSEIVDYWLTGTPDYATVTGVLQFDGTTEAGHEDDAYGIDLEFQKAEVSDEWDYLPIGSVSGTGGTNLDGFVEITNTGDDRGIKFLEQISVGTVDEPRESVFGQGDSTTDGMTAYHTADDVSYIDITETLASDSNSTTSLFGGTAPDNTIYIGSGFRFYGVKAKIATDGVVEPENIVVEYWDGTTWLPENFMATSSGEPLTSYGWQLAQSGTGSEQWRFDYDPEGIKPDWQQTSVNGVTKYWVRFRVVTAITLDPIMEQIKLHTSRYEINARGDTEYFGTARYKRTILSGVNSLVNNAAQSPANGAVAYSTGVVAGYEDNQFNNNAIDSRLFVLNVDEGLDTSIPVEVDVSWYVDGVGTGDVEFILSRVTIEDGFIYDGTATLNRTSSYTTPVVIPSDLQRKTTKMFLDINDAGQEAPAYLVVIQRDATGGNPNDTVPNNVILTHVVVNGWFWKP